MSTQAQRIALYGPVLVASFASLGLPPEWGLAFARQESNFDPTAKALVGGDALRGGSYGICQMSLRTARGLGFLASVDDLLRPRINADLAAHLCLQLCQHWKTRELKDIAAGYNSGKRYAKTTDRVRTTYADRVVIFANAFKEQGASMLRAVSAHNVAAIASAKPQPALAS